VEEFNGLIHVRRLSQVNAHPSALRKNVMGFRSASGHQFVSNRFWERNVHEMVAMHVTDFPPPQTIFRPAKSVWVSFDAGAVLQSKFYSFLGS
jgi:hypothetical protein